MSKRPDSTLRQLDIELPASPGATMRLSELLATDDTSVPEVAEVIEGDLALAAAVVRTVNSAMFGVLRRVETVAEAVMYLGMREVAAITLELGLRTRFPSSAEVNQIWDRARLRGLLMGRSAVSLGLHAWRAQSAGLFAQSGQAVLCLHAPQEYPLLLEIHGAPGQTAALLAEEVAHFGVSHDVLGSSLCRAWGLAADVADYIRERTEPAASWADRPPSVQGLLALGAVADAQLAGAGADALAQVASEVGPIAGPDPSAMAKAVTQQWARIQSGQEPD